MLRERYEPETWGYVELPDGSNAPLRHWENLIGSSRSCDVVLRQDDCARTHAALIRGEDGLWTLFDLDTGSDTYYDGYCVPPEGIILRDGDSFSIGGSELRFIDLTEEERSLLSKRRTKPGSAIRPGLTLTLVTLFQALLALQLCYTMGAGYAREIVLAFGALALIEWCYYLVMRSIRRMGFEVETLAFLLCSVGFAVCASSVPEDLVKQVILTLVGIGVFIILGWWLRDLRRARAMRWTAAAAAIVFLAVNLILSRVTYGARNWVQIGSFTVQPSEFVKVLYIYAGAATLDRLYMGRNLFMYIGFSAVCVGALALMGDFGTALIFFVTFLVISFMRSGNLATVFLAITAAALAGLLVLTVKPYIAQRFATWGHVWEYAYDEGFQQTRTLSAAASGGLFGYGAGGGWLKGIFAANTDLVFGMVCEELGLIIALLCAGVPILFAAFTVKNSAQGRSSFYVIAACAAVSMMLVQMALNIFGSVDILPLTGVTFPFVSIGGSSLISCWALLAFIKAGDTRRGASFVVKPLEAYRDAQDEYDALLDYGEEADE
jgi:cell division protein FtsW (lipid II flippase)